jgi:hypothetical protein
MDAKLVLVMSAGNAATGASMTEAETHTIAALASKGIVVVDDRSLADYHPGPETPVAALCSGGIVATV